MTSKRTEKVVTSVIDKVISTVSIKYNIDVGDLRSLLNDIPGSLECGYLFTKGKRRGEKCGVVLCVHHKADDVWSNIDETKNNIVFAPYDNIIYNTFNHANNYSIYEHKNNGDGTMRNAIQESTMMANIDNRRRLDGKVPLGVTQPYKNVV
jgi:hypothetical protein